MEDYMDGDKNSLVVEFSQEKLSSKYYRMKNKITGDEVE